MLVTALFIKYDKNVHKRDRQYVANIRKEDVTLTVYINPLIVQRANPFIYKHSDGYYYFTASVPAYNLIEIRRAKTLEGLAHAAPRTIWRKHKSGPMSQLIWAPEIHYIDGKWFIYFAASETTALDENGMFQHRMFCIECDNADPMRSEDDWVEHGQVQTGMDSFSLDATCFEANGKLYYVWAQKIQILKAIQISILPKWKIHGHLKQSRSCFPNLSLIGKPSDFGSTKGQPSFIEMATTSSPIRLAQLMSTMLWEC